MNDMYIAEASWSKKQMQMYLAKLVRMLQPKRGVLMVELEKLGGMHDANSGYDVWHLGVCMQNQVFTNLILKSMELNPLQEAPELMHPLTKLARCS